MSLPRGPTLVALLVAASGCEDERYPWEAADPTIPGPTPVPCASASTTAPPSAEPLPFEKPKLEGGLFTRCAEGFRAGTDPLRDVTRLALSCGPSTGMTRVGDGPHEGAVAEGTAEVRLPMSFAEGHCYRIFAVGGDTIEDLTVEVRSSRGTLVGGDLRQDRIAIVQPDRPICPPAAEEMLVTVGAAKGRGAFALEVWEVPGH